MNRPPAFVLGVDGGNTKTIAAIARTDGAIVGLARGGGSDIYARESEALAIAEICRTAETALGNAGLKTKDLAAAAFSLAGADWPEDFALLEGELTKGLDLQVAPLVVNDAMGALRSGTPDYVGISVACGTYNAIGARNRDGRFFHLGAWPDRAGGYDLGMEAFKATFREVLELGPPTALSKPLLERFKAKDGLELMHAFMRRENRLPMRDIRHLAPLVLEIADRGDAVARAIVVAAGRVLGEQARVAAKRVGLPLKGTRVVLTGGVLAHQTPLVADAIMSVLPGAIALRTKAPPVTGALLLALDALGVATDGDRLADALTRQL